MFRAIELCISELHDRYFQKEIFFASGISKQAYFKHGQMNMRKDIMEQEILQKVYKARVQNNDMGARPLYHALKVTEIGINKFEQLLAAKGLNVQLKRKRWIKTTDGVHEEFDVNRVKGSSIYDINKVIVGDITYFFTGDDVLYYIFSLKDAYSKRVIGIYGSERMTGKAGVKCLDQVIELRGEENLQDCIHHTDAGSQYKSKVYKGRALYFKWSIAENCLENGMAEQLNFIIKSHYLRHYEVKNIKSLNRLLKKIQKIINEERPVAALGYLTPVEFEKSIQQIPLELRKPFKFSSFEKGKKRDFEGGIA